MHHYGLVHPLNRAGYYETDHHRRLLQDIREALPDGRLIAVCGVVGAGKTLFLRRLQQLLREESRVIVSQSLAVEKHSIKLSTLITALFYDLSPDKAVRIPAQGEKRERELRDLVKKSKRPVALFVDEAHDLHPHTLIGLKRLLEVVESGGVACRSSWPVIPSSKMTSAARPWKRSVIAPTFSPSMASPAASASIFVGCCPPAPKTKSRQSRY